jgi:hypothetical protein
MNKVCCVQDCDRDAFAKAMCGMHYMRLKRTGSPFTVRRVVGLSAEERFWQYVNKTDDCWLWTGATSHGYGNFYLPREGRTTTQIQAHVFAYQTLRGPVPEGLVIDHLCRTKRCVRPDHLDPVTQQLNVIRGDVARVLRENTCRHGHEYTPENTHINRKGAKVCRICMRASQARYRAKVRGQSM